MESNISSDLIRGHIDTIILNAILSGDKHAQQISDYIEEKSENNYKINQATLYSSLKRLESLEYISSYWHDIDDGRRKFFKITEKGNELLNDNLSSWSYSRGVINKLIDCPDTSSEPIIKYVEKPIYIEKPLEENTTSEKNDEFTETNAKIDAEFENKTIPSSQNSNNDDISEKEINFRNILNGLIVNQVTLKKDIVDIKEEIEDKDNTEEEGVAKLNETIAETKYTDNGGNIKIDFGDLAISAAKEGYKIKISSKDSLAPKGVLLINKLNFASCIFALILAIIESIIYFTVYSGKIGTLFTVLIPVCFLIYPIVSAILYLRSPNKVSPKNPQKDGILTAIIIAFNIILFSIAGNILFNVNFSDGSIISKSFVLPIAIAVDVLIFMIIRYNLSKNEKFKYSVKKN